MDGWRTGYINTDLNPADLLSIPVKIGNHVELKFA